MLKLNLRHWFSYQFQLSKPANNSIIKIGKEHPNKTNRFKIRNIPDLILKGTDGDPE
jgi:hypothetical protein